MATTNKNRSSLYGPFLVSDQRQVFGELLIQGRRSMLTLRDGSEINLKGSERHIRGSTVDGHQITCVDCIHSGQGSTSQERAYYHYTELFPHFVVAGVEHLDPDAPVIETLSFSVSDLNMLFYDPDAFGFVGDAAPIMDVVLTEKRRNRVIEVGDDPEVHYFTGKSVAMDLDTAIGNLVVRYQRRMRFGCSDGIHVKNDRRTYIKPHQPISFFEAIDRVVMLRRFFSVAAGRPQKIQSIRITTISDRTKLKPLRVHWSFAPKGPHGDHHQPDRMSRPFDPVGRPDEFMRALKNWIDRDDKMKIVRTRHLSCMEKADTYSVDRLVAAANMFDLLPPDTWPPVLALSDDLAEFQAGAVKTLDALPQSQDRNSVLAAVKRIGKPSLPKKVLHRWAIAGKDIPGVFPELDYVLKQAVKCRNHFVHGPSDTFKFERAEPFLVFMTDALEFVFGFSDLVESDWSAAQWGGRHYSNGHTFSRFRWGYDATLAAFKASMARST